MIIMDVIPKKIVTVYKSGKNIINRCYGDDNFDYGSNSIKSTKPFVLDCKGRELLLTSDKGDPNINRWRYSLLVNKKPRRAEFLKGNIHYIQWLKHSNIDGLRPDDIVNSWAGQFLFKKEDLDRGINGLRKPQLGAIYSFLSHAQNQKDRNIIVMPTGTGKTETMLSVLVANQCGKLLVTVPTNVLRDQLASKFLDLGVLPKFGIVKKKCKLPFVANIKEGMDLSSWELFIEKSNVVITTMSLIDSASDEIKSYISRSFTHIFIDEAHHSAANTWSKFIDQIDDRKLTLFTATPFRNDGKKLKGTIIYNFSLSDAQNQGYYKTINFIPVREYNLKKADEIIAQKAVGQLKKDLEQGLNHILMARCATIKRAQEIFEYYKDFPEFNPVVINSTTEKQNKLIEEIKQLKHKIIICVDMLGEGFDLPELKIAAIHDPRQSIPITLQFIGRFTRTSRDKLLGSASFVANIANEPIADELSDLYAKDADWNKLLPIYSDSIIKNEIDLKSFINSFNNLDDTKVPFQNIHPALSVEIFSTNNTWHPDLWVKFFNNEEYAYRYFSINKSKETFIIILGRISRIDWGKADTIQNLTWDYVIVHRKLNRNYNHAYINSSMHFPTLAFAKLIFGEETSLISGSRLFRCFHNVKRLALTNLGAYKRWASLGGFVSFKSYYGRDVKEGIRKTEKKELDSNNMFGFGYKYGLRTSIGCSMKGRIWSYQRGNILELVKWAENIGAMVENPSIEENEYLKNLIHSTPLKEFPDKANPIGIDWDNNLYKEYASYDIHLSYDDVEIPLYDVELRLSSNEIQQYIPFEIVIENNVIASYKIEYEFKKDEPKYIVSQINGSKVKILIGSRDCEDICDYFNNNSAPMIIFADGSELYSLNLISGNNDNELFDRGSLITLDWKGVDKSKESQGVIPYFSDSIQYYFSNYLLEKFDILYDDDGSGEIADLIGIKESEDKIEISLFHLKYAIEGKISNDISNFYEVCGQAIKSLRWNDSEKTRILFERLFARKDKRYKGRECSRFLKGTEEDLERVSKIAYKVKPIHWDINIVQPGLSAKNASKSILALLGNVNAIIEDITNSALKVYCSK